MTNKTYSEQQLTQIFEATIPPLGDDLKWRFEERFSALLSEFARDKRERVYEKLQVAFAHEWDRKTIKKAPNELKSQLASLAKLDKDQIVFSHPAQGDSPTMIALWWPWGHRGTYSVRLLALENSYQVDATKRNILSRIAALF